MLGAFLFRGDDVFKSLSVLSGGEKSRLAMLRMLLKPMNLLILDEPTNHLDLQSKDILLDCLKAFEGTIIFVSHDRGFMEALSTKTLELSIGRAAGEAELKRRHRLFYGNYGYYLDRIAKEESNQRFVSEINTGDNLEMKPQKSQPAAAPVIDVSPEPLPKVILVKAGDQPLLSAAERREQEKQKQAIVRRLERQEAETLSAMEKLETEKKRLEEELGKPEVYSSGEKARAVKLTLDETAAALEAKSREWEGIAGELEMARRSVL
jgi:ATP-binding cassette subfamily F protein 3